MNHFARFGLPRRYEVDRAALDQAYERLSFEYHPDLMAAALSGAAPERVQEAQRISAELNEGYRVLRTEAERAAYLLGLLAAEHLPPGQKLDTERLPAGFLQEMFLLQEEVDELGADAGAPRRSALLEQVRARLRETLHERAELFRQAGPGSNTDVLQAIQSNLNQEKYLQRLLARLQE